jgi:hypothetical protein
MLKYIRGLILVVAVLVSNAYVPPAYAASATVMITHIQAGGAGAALQELIILYNNSTEEINITGWCLKNKTNEVLACFQPEHPTYGFYLAGKSYATIGSMELAQTLQPIGLSIVYIPMNGSSGGIVGSSDTIKVVDQAGMLVDSHSWTTGLTGGTMLARKLNTESSTYVDTDHSSDWQVSTLQNIPIDGVQYRGEIIDFCPNIEDVQTEVPEGLEIKWDGQCLPPPLPLLITELLPNVSGSDVGKEFIELYNPNDYEISLDDYSINVGVSFEDPYHFPAGSVIAPKSYRTFDNAVMVYSLLNSSSRVQLLRSIEVLYETPSYMDPDEDTSWALINGMWQYTNQLTPGAENRTSSLPGITNNVPKVSSLKPCAANQYRHSETNRCRRIIVAAAPTSCKQGQYRSKETNRCRKLAVSAVPAPCKEGQERNPETNRCRNIVAITQADYAVLGTQTSSNGSWYIWVAISGLILAALGYAVWEWRYELRKLLVTISARFARKHK